jgi:hypothetical protein
MESAMGVAVFLLLLVVAVVFLLSRTPAAKGRAGEAKVKIATDRFLDNEKYRRIDDVTLRVFNGTTQIDHVIVSEYGVFVVETKNMKGWIFGREDQAEWTQKLYRRSYRFQNPLRQNYKHVKALQDVLGMPRSAIHSVVVFYGNVKFKTPMPENVTHKNELINYIKSFTVPIISKDQCDVVLHKIDRARVSPTDEANRQHVETLRERFSGESKGICPKCGDRLVLRIAKNGPTKGKQFLGCSEYPRCKYTISVT